MGVILVDLQTFSFANGASATLRAVWKSAVPTTMQTFTASYCSSMSTGASLTLTDSRDSNIYTVKKLADGKCWMTQNLRFTDTGTLSSSTSDVSSSNTFALGSSTSSFSTSCTNSSQWLDTGNTSYGVYYNWYAATAGSGTCSMTSGSASYSICPKNWRLPTNTEWNTLYTSSGSSASNMLSTSGGYPGLVPSGRHTGSSTDSQGSYGNYWASTASGANYAYSLSLNGSSVSPQHGNLKYLGYTVRCVASS